MTNRIKKPKNGRGKGDEQIDKMIRLSRRSKEADRLMSTTQRRHIQQLYKYILYKHILDVQHIHRELLPQYALEVLRFQSTVTCRAITLVRSCKLMNVSSCHSIVSTKLAMSPTCSNYELCVVLVVLVGLIA